MGQAPAGTIAGRRRFGKCFRRVTDGPGGPPGVTSGDVKDLLAAGLYYLYELSR
jgi:hypothetical protein